MKVGTDGVLLGAWATVPDEGNILDVGSGTGLLALMCAQRSKSAQIEAVEINPAAAMQAEENCRGSNWSHRIRVVNDSFQDFSHAHATGTKYDLIISNPPFFRDSLKPPADSRSMARHNDKLSADLLLYNAARVLTNSGIVSIIYPAEDIEYLISTAFFYLLYPIRRTFIKPYEGKKNIRCLIEFGQEQGKKCTEDIIAIRSAAGEFSEDYKKLTAAFYLKF